MPLYAILSDDKTRIREIRDFPPGTVFKSGFAFPVSVEPAPDYDPKTSYIEQVPSLPVKGVVTISWAIRELDQSVKDAIVKSDQLNSTFDQLQAIKEKIDSAGGKLESADQTALLTYTLETLLQLREPLIQIQKRSA